VAGSLSCSLSGFGCVYAHAWGQSACRIPAGGVAHQPVHTRVPCLQASPAGPCICIHRLVLVESFDSVLFTSLCSLLTEDLHVKRCS
jgi:hypothetical protein